MKSLKRTWLPLAAISLLLATVACSKSNAAFKDSVQKALEQADLQGVSVAEDADKNTITLSGKLHSDDAKQRAGQVAQSVAGDRVIANEISVEPLGMESQAKDIESNLDDGIESNYKATLISHGLDKESISFDSKNGVLTLKGKVQTSADKAEAQQLASNIPHVAQVVNQLDVRR